jgi:hypothetical protein
MSATEYRSMCFHAMPNNPAAAVGARRRQNLNGAFKAVKHMGLSSHGDLKGFIVIISTLFALSHVEISLMVVLAHTNSYSTVASRCPGGSGTRCCLGPLRKFCARYWLGTEICL